MGANVHVSDLAYANEFVILNRSYREAQGLLEVVNRHDTVGSMRINVSKIKVMSAKASC